MINYIYYSASKQRHISVEREDGNPDYSFVLQYDNLKFYYNEYELIITLNYLKLCHLDNPPPPPSIEAINNFATYFPEKLATMTFYCLLVKPELVNVFYPHHQDFYLFFDHNLETYGISSSPRFIETNSISIISSIPHLSNITAPNELCDVLNFVKLGKQPKTILTNQQIEHQISLFPELFAI